MRPYPREMTQPNQKKANSKTYSSEVHERAIRLVLEHHASYASRWEAIKSIASKIGCTAETLRGWGTCPYVVERLGV